MCVFSPPLNTYLILTLCLCLLRNLASRATKGARRPGQRVEGVATVTAGEAADKSPLAAHVDCDSVRDRPIIAPQCDTGCLAQAGSPV